MKKLKAFTLVELLVAIAVFCILMTGIMQMVEPVSKTATNAKVMNDQRNVENAIVRYIGENLRVATNLYIVEGGTPQAAVKKFLDAKPVDIYGKEINDESKVSVIAFDGSEIYEYPNDNDPHTNDKGYGGRLISKIDGETLTESPFSQDDDDCQEDGSGTYYIALGQGYYQQGDYYLNVELDGKMLNLSVYSDFYLSTGSKRINNGAKSSTAGHPIEGVYEIMAVNSKPMEGAPNFVFGTVDSDSPGISSTPSEPHTIYFVYTTNDVIRETP